MQLQEMEQQKQPQQAVLNILQDGQHEARIVTLCNKKPITQAHIEHLIVGDRENSDEENEFDGENDQGDDDQLRRLLQQFCNSNKTIIDLLSVTELPSITCLSVFPAFAKEFSLILPSLVITSSLEPEEGTPERDAKRQRRDARQRKENACKSVMQDLGGPVEFQVGRTVVLPREDEKADEPN